jgi:hypothetical protein
MPKGGILHDPRKDAQEFGVSSWCPDSCSTGGIWARESTLRNLCISLLLVNGLALAEIGQSCSPAARLAAFRDVVCGRKCEEDDGRLR